MKKILALILVAILMLCFTVTAFAETYNSNQGGEPGGPTAPRTGSVAVAVLAAVAAISGGVFAFTNKRGK